MFDCLMGPLSAQQIVLYSLCTRVSSSQRIVLGLDVTPMTEHGRYARDCVKTTVSLLQHNTGSFEVSQLCLVISTVSPPCKTI